MESNTNTTTEVSATPSPSSQTYASTFSTGDLNVLQICVRFSGLLSMIGTLAIILSYMTKREKLGSTPSRLILYLAIADFLGSAVLMIGQAFISRENTDSMSCQIHGMLIHTTLLMSVLWTTVIAVNLYLTIVRKKEKKVLATLEVYFHIICWGIPLVLCTVFMLPSSHFRQTPIYGDAELWCWITADYKDLRMYTFYIPLWLSFLVIAWCYFAVGRSMKQNAVTWERCCAADEYDVEKMKESLSRYVTKTNLFLMVYFLSWAPATVNRILALISPQTHIFWLYIVHSILVPLVGFLNSIIFFWSNAYSYLRWAYKKREGEEETPRKMLLTLPDRVSYTSSVDSTSEETFNSSYYASHGVSSKHLETSPKSLAAAFAASSAEMSSQRLKSSYSPQDFSMKSHDHHEIRIMGSSADDMMATSMDSCFSLYEITDLQDQLVADLSDPDSMKGVKL